MTTTQHNGLAENECLLMTYFTGNGEAGLKMAVSDDGYTFRALRDGEGFWTSTVGQQKLVRDPSVCAGPDGWYHFVWTTGWHEPYFGYRRTRDFQNWEPQRLIEPWQGVKGVNNCWAPEITFDADHGHFMIYWSSTLPNTKNAIAGDDGNHRIYQTVTTDFLHFNPTRPLYDPGYNVIDASIVRDGGRWLMFVKDERKVPRPMKCLYIAASETLEGPYEPLGKPFTGKLWAEGPTAVQLGGRWFCYFDRYADHHYALMTSDDLTNWKDESAAIKLPPGVRHATVIRVPRQAVRAIV